MGTPNGQHEEFIMRMAGAIFDCDGTLLDTMGLWHAMESELARMAGHRLTDEEVDRLCTFTLPETARFFHEEHGLGSSAAEVEALIREMAVDYYRTRATPRPGVEAFLQALRDAGVPCAVASSSPHFMLGPGLEESGLAEYIGPVVSVDDVGASKREPAAYDRARELLETPREQTWVFEDAAYALRCAKTAGYPTVAVWDCDESGTFEELGALADIAVRSFEELRLEAGQPVRRPAGYPCQNPRPVCGNPAKSVAPCAD